VYRLAIREGLDKKLKKLKRKDPELLQMIERKVQVQNKRRVHIGGSFVLIYEIYEKQKIVTLLDFDHHDNVYKT